MWALEPRLLSWCSSAVPATASTPPATSFPTHGGSAPRIAAAQMWAGFALFAVFLFFNRARGERWAKLGCANILKLLGVGAATCITSIFYTYAMSVLPVALALTLLFQFTWIGTVIQVIMTRRPPAFSQVISAAIIVFGTVFASGLYATDLSSCNPWGIAAGLLAAVSFVLGPVWSGAAKMFTGPAGFDYLRWRCNCVAFHLPRLHCFGRALARHRPFGLNCRSMRVLPAYSAPKHGCAPFACGANIFAGCIRAASWAVCSNDSARIAHRCR